MSVSSLFSQQVNAPTWPTLCLFGLAGVALISRMFVRHTLTSMAFAVLVSIAGAVELARIWPAPSGAVPGLARSCAAIALIWSCCGAVVPGNRFQGFGRISRLVTLLLAVVSVSVLSVVLVMRVVFVAIDIIRFDASPTAYRYGFGADGLWPLGFILVAGMVAWLLTQDRRLITCQLWCAIVLTTWAWLLGDPVRVSGTGGVERTSLTLGALGTVPFLILATVLVTRWIDRGRREHAERSPTGVSEESMPVWPGLGLSVTTIATVELLLVCYHMAVPVALSPGGYRLAALIVAGSAGVTALACFILLRSAWSVALADSAMALGSLGLPAGVTVLVPAEPHALAARYPLLFNAMILGLAIAVGGCVWLGSRAVEQAGRWGVGSIVGRLGPHARRFAFLNAALALVISAAMAIWPQWPSIAIMDHSLSRVTAGLAADFALLLVTFWAYRRLHRPSFQVLSIMVLLSIVAFVTVRMLPFTG